MTDVGRDKALRAKIVEALDPFYPNPEAQCPIVIDALVKVLTPPSPVPGWVMVPREMLEWADDLYASLFDCAANAQQDEAVAQYARVRNSFSAAPVLTAPEGEWDRVIEETEVVLSDLIENEAMALDEAAMRKFKGQVEWLRLFARGKIGFSTPELLEVANSLEALAAMLEVQRRVSGAGWMGIESAPKDGTPIRILNMDGTEDIVQWEEYRACMLGSRAGAYPPGWQCVENKLPIDTPTHWKPAPPGDRGTP